MTEAGATTDLAGVLTSLGVEVKRQSNDEINARCPVHHKVKGRESGGYTWYMNAETGLWLCYTCGARGNLSMLLSEMTDDPAALWDVQNFVITQGLRRLEKEEAVYDDHVEVDWNTYSQFAPLPSRMLELRNLDADVAKRYGVRWDKEKKAIIVPILSPLGELRGWQAKKSGWVRNLPEGVQKHTTLFGIERAHAPTAILVESPLDVVRFHSVYEGLDYSCVSSFGANISKEQGRLLAKFDIVVLALDNDEAGRAETKRIVKQDLIDTRRRYWQYSDKDPKDIGEMTDAQIIKGLRNVSVAR
jgi:hypothetical protein